MTFGSCLRPYLPGLRLLGWGYDSSACSDAPAATWLSGWASLTLFCHLLVADLADVLCDRTGLRVRD